MKKGIGLFEIVLIAGIAVAAYALILKSRPHAKAEAKSEPDRAAPIDREEPAAPAPTPEPEPPPVAAPEPAPVPEEPPPTGDIQLPESLDAPMIKDGVAGVRDAVYACGEKYPDASGIVKLKVRVNPDGTVAKVEVVESDSRRLGACAAAAVKKARFVETEHGGLFNYPFQFDAQ